jgi:hypothetical protein
MNQPLLNDGFSGPVTMALESRKTDRISDTHTADAVRHRVTWAAEARTRKPALRFIPYEEVRHEKVELPKRSKKDAYDDVASSAARWFVPEKH